MKTPWRFDRCRCPWAIPGVRELTARSADERGCDGVRASRLAALQRSSVNAILPQGGRGRCGRPRPQSAAPLQGKSPTDICRLRGPGGMPAAYRHAKSRNPTGTRPDDRPTDPPRTTGTRQRHRTVLGQLRRPGRQSAGADHGARDPDDRLGCGLLRAAGCGRQAPRDPLRQPRHRPFDEVPATGRARHSGTDGAGDGRQAGRCALHPARHGRRHGRPARRAEDRPGSHRWRLDGRRHRPGTGDSSPAADAVFHQHHVDHRRARPAAPDARRDEGAVHAHRRPRWRNTCRTTPASGKCCAAPAFRKTTR